ncbi:MAG TPA: hypothetical protein VNO30_31905 [Kofleriaceae bacterium]|nr:hypothetical protein [Kofleriaceae bacterium]
MSTFDFKGKIFHIPGPWGLKIPATGTAVTITDVDAPGRGDDTLWNGTTNHDGEYKGTASEWQDKIKLWVPPHPVGGFPPRWEPGYWKEVPDPLDVLVLKARVKQGTNDATLPLIINNGACSDLIVPWAPPPRLLGKVNGKEITAPDELTREIKAAVNTGAGQIRIEVYGPETALLMPLTGSRAQREGWLKQRLQMQGAGLSYVWGGDDVFWVLVGVAIIAIAVGVSVAIVGAVVGMIYAIKQGYVNINFKQNTTLPGGVTVGFEIQLQR